MDGWTDVHTYVHTYVRIHRYIHYIRQHIVSKQVRSSAGTKDARKPQSTRIYALRFRKDALKDEPV